MSRTVFCSSCTKHYFANDGHICPVMMQALGSSQMINSPEPSRGTKFNKGKPRFSLVPVESLEEIMKVLEAGAVKYGEYNWTKGIPFTEILDAMHRHYLAYSKGEDKDPESGFSHVAHLGANVMFLLWYEKFKPEFDNRFKNPVKKPE